jgi:hypothetical protein
LAEDKLADQLGLASDDAGHAGQSVTDAICAGNGCRY